MSDARSSRRTVAEVDAGAAQSGCPGIGNRSIHQFWHLFGAQFRDVLLAPRRRPDSGTVGWTWREPAEQRALTPTELAAVRRRLASASRALTGRAEESDDADEEESASLDAQVRNRVAKMTAGLLALTDEVLGRYVCRTEAGLMLHSWGAATPALPTHPEEGQGIVSGTVLLDGSTLAGASVVLETQAGLPVARLLSDRTGAFRFQGIVAGNYRLRVADRKEFSAAGLTCVMERTALTGLELRAGHGTSGSGLLRASSAITNRRLFLSLGLLLLVGAGAAAWYFTERAPAPVAEQVRSSGWQAASGKLVSAEGAETSPVSRPQSGDAHSVGLTGNVSAPTLVKIRESRALAVGIVPEEWTASANPAVLAEHKASADQPRNREQPVTLNEPHPLERKSPAPSDRLTAAANDSVNPEGRDSAGKSLAAVPSRNSDATASLALTSVRPQRTASLGASRTSAVLAEPEARAPAAALHAVSATESTDPETPATSNQIADRSSPPSATQASATSSSNTLGAGGLQSSAGKAAAESSDHLSASPGGHRVELTGGTRGEGATVLSLGHDLSNATAATAVTDDPVPVSKRAGAQPARAAKPEANPPHSPPATAERAEPLVGNQANRPPKQPRPAAGGQEFTRPVRIAATAWKARLLNDAIVPTMPLAAGQNESLGALRAQLRQTQEARLPQTFRDPVTGRGFVLEFDIPAAIPMRSARWHDAAGGEPVGATVQSGRAEINLAAEKPDRSREYILDCPDGTILAQITVDTTGVASLATGRSVRSWYWLRLEKSGPAAAAEAGRFEWGLLTGEPIPGAWRTSGSGQSGPGPRLEVPLQPGGAGGKNYPVALLDRSTGWALACSVSLN